jgi:site-specific DNA-methyltransferase (adenine-specific)
MSNPKWFKYEWIWEKDKCSNFMLAKVNPLKAHENIIVFGKNKINYYPQKTEGHKKANFTNANQLKQSDLYSIKPIGKHGHTDRYPRSVQKVNTHNSAWGQLHPTQKPEALLEYLVKTYTNEGETVLDNTMGSGTTGVACKNLNRSFIGIEMDDKYFEIAKHRIESHVVQSSF